MRISIILSIVFIFIAISCTGNKSIRFTETDAFLDTPFTIPDWMFEKWIYVGSSLDENDTVNYKREVVLFDIHCNKQSLINVGNFKIQFSDNIKHTFTCMSYCNLPVLHYKRVISSPGKPNIIQYCLVEYYANNGIIYRSPYHNSEAINTTDIVIPLATLSMHQLFGKWRFLGVDATLDINCVGDWRVKNSNQSVVSVCINLQQIGGLFLYEVVNNGRSVFTIYRLDNDIIYGSDVYLTIEEAKSDLVNRKSVVTIPVAQRIVPSLE